MGRGVIAEGALARETSVVGEIIGSGGKVLNNEMFLQAGRVIDREGFTAAGRGSMKHGYREGSVFPKPVGNPSQINEHGQKILERILNHPEREVISGEFKRFGQVIDIYAPDIGGVRYSAEGKFIGFLEPKGK